MIRGGTTKNIHSDSSKLDTGALEEKANLKRQYRTLKGEVEASKIHSQELIRKQCLEIKKLCEQHKELQEKLRVSQSQPYRQSDNQCGQELRALLKRCDELDKHVEKERLIQEKLEKEIQSVQKKMEAHKQESEARQFEEVTRTLENELEHAVIRLNKKAALKRQLKNDVESLHMDRVQFLQLHRNLDKELQEVQQDIDDVINITMSAQKDRAMAQKRTKKMKEKEKREQLKHMTDVNELERRLTEEKRLDTFIATKCRDRTGLEDGTLETKWWTEVPEEDLEEVFWQLQELTNEEDLDVLVSNFFQGEERTFSLNEYVNWQISLSEDMKQEIKELKEKIERIQAEDLVKEKEHHDILMQMEEQQDDTKAQTLECQTRAIQITDSLGQIYTGVNDVFNEIKCDQAALENLLSGSGGIGDLNVMMYLKLMEQKIDETVAIQKFIKSKVPDQKPVSEVQKQIRAFEPPSFSDELPPIPHEDERPLTLEEVRQHVRGWDGAKRDLEIKKAKERKLKAQSSHKKHMLTH